MMQCIFATWNSDNHRGRAVGFRGLYLLNYFVSNALLFLFLLLATFKSFGIWRMKWNRWRIMWMNMVFVPVLLIERLNGLVPDWPHYAGYYACTCNCQLCVTSRLFPKRASYELVPRAVIIPVQWLPSWHSGKANFTRLASFIALTKSDTIQRVSWPFPSKSRFPPIPRAYTFGFNVTMPWMQWKQ
jgi:hypothetical protein